MHALTDTYKYIYTQLSLFPKCSREKLGKLCPPLVLRPTAP